MCCFVPLQALDLRPGDKNCLVARSQCYLELGNADAALADAEATLSDDKNFIQVQWSTHLSIHFKINNYI